MNISLTNQVIQHGICSYTAKRNHLNGNVALLIQTIRGNMLSNSIEKSYKCNHCEYATSEQIKNSHRRKECQVTEHFVNIHNLFFIDNAIRTFSMYALIDANGS